MTSSIVVFVLLLQISTEVSDKPTTNGGVCSRFPFRQPRLLIFNRKHLQIRSDPTYPTMRLRKWGGLRRLDAIRCSNATRSVSLRREHRPSPQLICKFAILQCVLPVHGWEGLSAQDCLLAKQASTTFDLLTSFGLLFLCPLAFPDETSSPQAS